MPNNTKRRDELANARQRSIRLTEDEWTLIGEAVDGLLGGGLCEEAPEARAAFVRLVSKVLRLPRGVTTGFATGVVE